jgi:hypothetical protein
MLESVRQYFQDWSDACEYANECAPDLSFLGNGEPFTALAFIAAVCFLIYSLNEARIRRRAAAPPLAAPQDAGETKPVVEEIAPPSSLQSKLAA